MYSICYVSAASAHMEQDELLDLLAVSRKNNTELNITGLLLYNGKGTFVQVLEGEQAVVEKLYETIKNDTRHQRINCLGKKAIHERSFPNWSMGFKTLTEESLASLPGYSDFMESEDSTSYVASHSSFAFALLSHFKQSVLSH